MDAFTRSEASEATLLAPIAEPREDRRVLLALEVGARCPPPLGPAAKPPEDSEAAPLTEPLEDGRALLALEAGARCPPTRLGPAAKPPEDNEAPLAEPPEDERALLAPAPEASARCPPMGFAEPEDCKVAHPNRVVYRLHWWGPQHAVWGAQICGAILAHRAPNMHCARPPPNRALCCTHGAQHPAPRAHAATCSAAAAPHAPMRGCYQAVRLSRAAASAGHRCGQEASGGDGKRARSSPAADASRKKIAS